MRRSAHVVVLALLAFLLLGPVPKSLAGPPAPRLKAADPSADVLGVSPNDAASYGTGTIVHADALRSGPHALVDVDVAFSGSSFASAVPSHEYTNEVHRLVTPKLAANASRGRGTGLELGLLSDPVPLIGQLAQAAAPASTGLIEHVLGPIGVPGVLTVDLLRAQAQARAVQGCVLGRDQAYGLGSVLKLNVLNGLLTTVANPPLREVSQSTSTSRIVPGSTPGRLGLKSETRQTIAPVTFFKGTPAQFTIEVLGEWALRATADGAKGQVSYGPLGNSPETPVLRILGDHGQVVTQLTTQQLLTDHGLDITIPGVAEIVLGEDPRMIGGNASSSPVVSDTMAAAAVDVVRVKLLNGALADVRVGHMEAAVSVPAGGVQCPGLTVTNTVDQPTVTPGQDFIYTITVTNPNDCDLRHMKLVDTLTVPDGTKITLVSATPTGGTLAGNTATWNELGPLDSGATKTVTIKVHVADDSKPGKLTGTAVATGVCPAEPAPTTDIHPPQIPGLPGLFPSPDDIPVTGTATVDGPTVGVCTVPNLAHLTVAQAKAALEAAGCTLGKVIDGGPPKIPGDLGKVVDQVPPVDTTVPLGTPVDVTIGGPVCIVPSLSGLTVAQATKALTDAGCDIGKIIDGPPPTNPGDVGKITDQTPPPGDAVKTGTKVDVTVTPPAGSCIIPVVTGMTAAEAKAKLEEAGCKLGDIIPGPENPAQDGKVTEQGQPGGTTVPRGTEVNVTVAGPACTVPDVTGLNEADAKTKIEAAGCVLAHQEKNTNNPADVGKVIDQTPTATTVVPKGSTVTVDVGTQVLGATLNKGADTTAAPNLAKTGGVVSAGLALWLLISGLLSQLAGSERLWRLARRLGR